MRRALLFGRGGLTVRVAGSWLRSAWNCWRASCCRLRLKSCRLCCSFFRVSRPWSASCSSSRARWPRLLKPKVPAAPASLCNWSRRLCRCCSCSCGSAACNRRSAFCARAGSSTCRRTAKALLNCCRCCCSSSAVLLPLLMGQAPDLAHLRGQLHRVEGFDDHIAGAEAAVMGDFRRLHLGGHKGHWHLVDVDQPGDLRQGLRAVHVRHHHV